MKVCKFVQTFQPADGRDVLKLKDSGAMTKALRLICFVDLPYSGTALGLVGVATIFQVSLVLWGNVFLTLKKCCFLHLALILVLGQSQTP